MSKTIPKKLAYRSYQVEQCKLHADYDNVMEHLDIIPRRPGIDETACEMFEKIAQAAIEIMGEYDCIDPLYDFIQENHDPDIEGQISDFQYEAMAESRVMGL